MNLSRRANHGGFFHYMDHLNRTSFGDPLLIKSKTKGNGGYIVTAIILSLAAGLFFLNEVIKHA